MWVFTKVRLAIVRLAIKRLAIVRLVIVRLVIVRLAIVRLAIVRLAKKVRLAIHSMQFERHLTNQHSPKGG